MTYFRRRTALKYGVGIGASIASPLAYSQGPAPIRIGVSLPLGGPMSNLGNDMVMGAEIAASQINRAGGLLGRKVELVIRDDKSSSTQAVANVREFTGNGINLIVGNTTSASALAVIPALEEANAVQVTPNVISMAVTHEKFSRHLFRTNTNDFMQMGAYARLAAELYPNVTRWTNLNVELESTLQSWELFKKAATLSYKAINKQVTFGDPIVSKFGATDYKNQVAAAMRSDADGVLQLVFGQGAVTMFQQGSALGLQNKFKVVLDRGNDPTFAKALGTLLPREYWMITGWHPDIYRDRPQSVAFEKEAAARLNGGAPGGFIFLGHLGMTALLAGVRSAKSTDTAAVIQALESTPIESAIGSLRFRKEDHQLPLDVNFMQVVGADTPERYKTIRSRRYPGADVIEPASPGKPFVA